MHVHFVGIGGIGMSGIAQVLVDLGYQVSGSDLHPSHITGKLERKGIHVYFGHAAENVRGANMVVVSSAVPSGNPEIAEARARQVPVVQRAEMLGRLMQERFGIAIAGTHGKTTTTSMVAAILEKAGKDPTVVVGGEVNGSGHNAKLGKSQYIVAEADESDASFLKLSPRIVVVTNIDADVNLSIPSFSVFNFDYEKTLQRVNEIFVEFLERIPSNGHAILCSDCPRLRAIAPKLSCSTLTFGLQNQADLTGTDISLQELNSNFTVSLKGKLWGKISLHVPGMHNILNALGAIGAVLPLGLSYEEIASALENFHGVKRRFQTLGEVNGIMIVDDYAHNPTKVRAVLSAAKGGWNRRTIAVFQPHRYTRTRFLHEDFAKAFDAADVLLVTEIYSAGETPIAGISGKALAEEIRQANPNKPVYFVPNESEAIQKLLSIIQSGDIVLTIGAGDVNRIGAELLTRLS